MGLLYQELAKRERQIAGHPARELLGPEVFEAIPPGPGLCHLLVEVLAREKTTCKKSGEPVQKASLLIGGGFVCPFKFLLLEGVACPLKSPAKVQVLP